MRFPDLYPPGSTGYRGNNKFCTVTCGYNFGLWFAVDGRLLRPVLTVPK